MCFFFFIYNIVPKIFRFYVVESIASLSSWCLFYFLKFSQFVIFINHS